MARRAHGGFSTGGFAVGRKQYDWFLRRVLMLPFDSDQVATIGRLELARDRALEIWEAARDAQLPPPQPAADVLVEGSVSQRTTSAASRS